jgi:hypothetical protein
MQFTMWSIEMLAQDLPPPSTDTTFRPSILYYERCRC